MNKLIASLVLLVGVVAFAQGLRIANPGGGRPTPYCRFADDCRSKFCANGMKIDRRGCPLRGCPCKEPKYYYPPLNCPVIHCITIPCIEPPCKCKLQKCLRDCGINGWAQDEYGCNTCTCKSSPPDPCRCGQNLAACSCLAGTKCQCPCNPCPGDPTIGPPLPPAPKPGICPAYRSLYTTYRQPWRSCTYDYECHGKQKCCAVGHRYYCVDPVPYTIYQRGK